MSPFLGVTQGWVLVSVLPLAPLSTMLASSSTLERLRSSPRPGSEVLGRRMQPSSPLSSNHAVGTFVSPSADSLIQDPQPRQSRSRRKGLSWNLPWNNRNNNASSIGLISPALEIEKAESGQATPSKTPWHHGWRTALFGSCISSSWLCDFAHH